MLSLTTPRPLAPAPVAEEAAWAATAKQQPGGAAVPLALLTDVLGLSAHDWLSFVGLRWHMTRRLDVASSSDARRAVEVASRCFEERVVLDADGWRSSTLMFARYASAASVT